MMRKPVVLITGASGEIGHGLINRLTDDSSRGIVTLDVTPLQPALAKKVQREVVGSILDQAALDRYMATAVAASPTRAAERTGPSSRGGGP